MTAYASRSFMLSALIHAVILAVVLFFMMPARPVEPISLPSPRDFVMLADTVSLQPQPSVTEVRPVIFTPPDVPVRIETPLVDEQTVASKVIGPSVQHLPARRSAAVTPTAPDHPSTRTTIEQFRRQHPAGTTPASSAQRPSLKPARIDVDTVLTPAPSVQTAAPFSTPAEAHAADTYLARLLAKLRAAHTRPAGLDAGLKVRVEFSLRADGSLAGVRLLESSGSRDFDASVLAVFRKLNSLGALPAGFSKTNRVTFRTDTED